MRLKRLVVALSALLLLAQFVNFGPAGVPAEADSPHKLYLPLIVDQSFPRLIGAGDTESLIEAIEAANANGPGSDTIQLSLSDYSLTSEYGSSSGLPTIASDIEIVGNGATLKRDSAESFRIFRVSSTGRLTLNDLSLEDGYTAHHGGAIEAAGGDLAIQGVDFIGNQGGFGGAIKLVDGTATIDNSRLIGNTGSAGSAIYNYGGDLTISNTLISNNGVSSTAAIYNLGQLSLENVVLSGNVGDQKSAAVLNAGTAFISDSYFLGNDGGALYLEHSSEPMGSVSLTGSCLASNAANPDGFVVQNSTTRTVTVEDNWWGAADGPSGAAGGSGEPISAYLDFSPYYSSVPSSCPAGDRITGVTAEPLSAGVPTGATLELSGKVWGLGSFDPSIGWQLISGGGSLGSTSGSPIDYTAPGEPGESLIRATALDEPELSMDVSLTIGEVLGFGTYPRSPSVLVGESFNLGAYVQQNGSADFDLKWEILSGGGSLGEASSSWSGSWKKVLYNAPASTGTSTLRASIDRFPSYYVDIPIDVVSSGPTSCFDARPIQPGPATYYVSWGSLEPNQPYAYQIDISELDPLPGEQQTVTVYTAVNEPSTEPVTSVVINLHTDNQTTGPLNLSKVTGSTDQWTGSWSFPEDPNCVNYVIEEIITNSLFSSQTATTVR